MKYVHATIIVATVVAANLRKLSQMLDRLETDGMFTTELSTTGNLPATHYISNGMVPKVYIKALSSPALLKAAAEKAYADEGVNFPFTLPQITNALSKCTISDGTTTTLIDGVPTVVDEGPFELLDRLGLKIIRTEI